MYFKYKHGHGVNTRSLSLLTYVSMVRTGKVDDVQLPHSLKNHLKFDNK